MAGQSYSQDLRDRVLTAIDGRMITRPAAGLKTLPRRQTRSIGALLDTFAPTNAPTFSTTLDIDTECENALEQKAAISHFSQIAHDSALTLQSFCAPRRDTTPGDGW